MNKEIFQVLIPKERRIYCKMKAKCRIVYGVCYILYREEYILVFNCIWTQEMHKRGYLRGQGRKLTVTKTGASLFNLY